MAGIAVGGVIGLEALFAGPISGASMNPARSLAPALLSGNTKNLWLYLAAPILGSVLSVPFWLATRGHHTGAPIHPHITHRPPRHCKMAFTASPSKTIACKIPGIVNRHALRPPHNYPRSIHGGHTNQCHNVCRTATIRKSYTGGHVPKLSRPPALSKVEVRPHPSMSDSRPRSGGAEERTGLDVLSSASALNSPALEFSASIDEVERH